MSRPESVEVGRGVGQGFSAGVEDELRDSLARNLLSYQWGKVRST